MFEEIRQALNEVIEISDTCPEKYQVKCFEVLISSLLRPKHIKEETYEKTGVREQSSIPFFSQNEISQDEWQKVFHHDGNIYQIIVNDLKEKTVAKKQVKLALLLGVKNLLENNEAYFEKDALIDICKMYSTYDSGNFAGHMKKNKHLFIQKSTGWALTIPGQQAAGNAIKELA